MDKDRYDTGPEKYTVISNSSSLQFSKEKKLKILLSYIFFSV